MLRKNKYERYRRQGRFLEQACGDDEKIMIYARMPLMTLVEGAFWCALVITGGTFAGRGALSFIHSAGPAAVSYSTLYYVASIGNYLSYAALIIGLVILSRYIVVYLTTRIALTNRRLLIRKGLVFVNLSEVDLEEIKSERITHGLLGRFFNYGRVLLDARFVEDFNLPYIHAPYRLLRSIHELRSTNKTTPPPFLNNNKKEGHIENDAPSEQIVQETDEYIILRKPA